MTRTAVNAVRRALSFVLALFLLPVAVFYLSRLSPGDPLRSYYGEGAERLSAVERAEALDWLGLDRPIYGNTACVWLKNALHGDFGVSFPYKREVLSVIGGVYGNTLLLGLTVYLLTFGLALPLAVLVLSHLWYCAYLIRNRLLDEARQDYVLLCRAEGLSRRRVAFTECLRNVLPSYFGLMAVSIPHILGGTYIMEKVFSYPGLGTLCFESAKYHDDNMLMVLCLMTGALDPRMKGRAVR